MLESGRPRAEAQSQTASSDAFVRDQALKQAGSQKQVLVERLEQHRGLLHVIQRLSAAPAAGTAVTVHGKEALQFPQPESFSFRLDGLLWPGMRMDHLCAAVFPDGVASGTALGAKVVNGDNILRLLAVLPLSDVGFPAHMVPFCNHRAKGTGNPPNRGFSLAYRSPEDAAKKSRAFADYKWACVPVCSAKRPCDGDEPAECEAACIIGKRWQDPEDLLYVEFFGSCCHLSVSYIEHCRRSNGASAVLTAIGQEYAPKGAKPQQVRAALLEVIGRVCPQALEYGNGRSLLSSKVIGKVMVDERKARLGMSGASLRGRNGLGERAAGLNIVVASAMIVKFWLRWLQWIPFPRTPFPR